MIHINTIPGQAMQKNGFAHYPKDFPHLAPGERFTVWRSGNDWEIETTLNGDLLMQRLRQLGDNEIEKLSKE